MATGAGTPPIEPVTVCAMPSDNYTVPATTTTLRHPNLLLIALTMQAFLQEGWFEVSKVRDTQVRVLMSEINKDKNVTRAAMLAGIHRHTAAKYIEAGKLPSEIVVERTWRTRADPFELDWPDVVGWLEAAPELEGKTLFEHLVNTRPTREYEPGQLRTFQRRVHEWRAAYGPDKEVFFSQQHRPGEAMQTDFTWATELGITIRGEPFVHMLCHCVLPFSNWQWATVCHSESMTALRKGIQAAVFRLGKTPTFHQTDNSTAATHTLQSGKQSFNDEYVALMRHLEMEPRTIEPGESHQNGDVEALNGALKRRLKQHLLMRCSRDFDSRFEYETWLENAIEKANGLRGEKVAEELAVMKALRVDRLAEYRALDGVRVCSGSTIRVLYNTYSVPARLIGESLTVHVYEDHLEAFYRDKFQLSVQRFVGRNHHRINYRDVIWSLVQKPGAFRRYRYRDDLFPTVTFRKAYDALCSDVVEHRADLEYLRILHLAASTMECEVEAALAILLEASTRPTADEVKALVLPRQQPSVPEMSAFVVDLKLYDGLLTSAGEVA